MIINKYLFGNGLILWSGIFLFVSEWFVRFESVIVKVVSRRFEYNKFVFF